MQSRSSEFSPRTTNASSPLSILSLSTTPKPVHHFDDHPLTLPSLWKPIRGPLTDYPLTLCDRRMIDYKTQTTEMDIVTQHFVNENMRIYYHEAHRWYYWKDLKEDEVLVFVQADSDAPDQAGKS